jgi:hypothetical protein
MADVDLTLQEIRAVLNRDAEITGAHRTSSWEAALGQEQARGEFGEATTDEALREIPDGKLVRLVLMTDHRGEALRWVVHGSPVAMNVLGGDHFDDIERGESQGPVFWGEMQREGDRALVDPRIP